jgi:serine/threonine-protein kinase
MTDSFDFRTGDVIADAYSIVRPIGIGGSAAVYRARHLSSDRRVALKIMHETDPSGIGKKRFEREAALVQRLAHPNIVQMHDFGYTDSGQPYISFSLLEGRSLKYFIKNEAPFDPKRLGRVTLEVLSALDVAHRMGIIHRDIKPANIFMSQSPHGETAQVLDFGLAKMLFGDEEELLATLTRTGFRLGTPRYMSPEMARGQRANEASDLYSLGLVMAEMITGTPIVPGNSQIDVLMAHASETELVLAPEVTASPFATIIQRAVAKGLDVRYRTALQMQADVSALLARLDAGRGAVGGEEDELAATLAFGSDVVNLEATMLDPEAQRPIGTIPIDTPPVPVPAYSQPSFPVAPPSPAPSPAPSPVTPNRTPVIVAMVIFAVFVIAAAVAGYVFGG